MPYDYRKFLREQGALPPQPSQPDGSRIRNQLLGDRPGTAGAVLNTDMLAALLQFLGNQGNIYGQTVSQPVSAPYPGGGNWIGNQLLGDHPGSAGDVLNYDMGQGLQQFLGNRGNVYGGSVPAVAPASGPPQSDGQRINNQLLGDHPGSAGDVLNTDMRQGLRQFLGNRGNVYGQTVSATKNKKK